MALLGQVASDQAPGTTPTFSHWATAPAKFFQLQFTGNQDKNNWFYSETASFLLRKTYFAILILLLYLFAPFTAAILALFHCH